MSKQVLIIDPGHGGKDDGGGSNKYFKEKDMNLKISLYQLKRFMELGVNTTLTRSNDIYLSSTERARIVRESGALYCISNHINAANAEVRGVEAIHSIYADGELAQAIYQAIVDEGMKPRRVFSKVSSTASNKDYYFMHRDTGAVQTVIIEYGFATNAEDTKLLIASWDRYAEAVVKAFCRYINHTYIPPKGIDNDSANNQSFPVIKKMVDIYFDERIIPAYLTNEGRTLVEVRKMAELVDLEVAWNENNTVTLKRR